MLFLTIFHTSECHALVDRAPEKVVDWLIVGAGPAGILTLGVLLDIGVDPREILWLDPEFNAGRLGAYYGKVFANSKAKDFVNFINTCATFKGCSCVDMDYLQSLDLEARGYELEVIIKPMQRLTEYLRERVESVVDTMTALYFEDNVWHVGTKSGQLLTAHHVVLATGSYPKILPYGTEKIIPLDKAIDRFALADLVKPTDVVGVVGSSHSAILLLKFLSEMPVTHIYNFYRSPLEYYAEKGMLLETSTTSELRGIAGVAAEWAKNVLEKNPPANLTRIYTPDSQKLATYLRVCTKVIYAIGYERNELPALNDTTPITSYNEKNGMIAPRLFGIGIAFPELVTDDHGNSKHCIGLDCFMEYAHRMIPQWVHGDQFKDAHVQRAQAQLQKLKRWSDLFTIATL
jgi:thioredoxin reductase